MALKFHLALNVANLQRSLAFYRILFGLEPSKCHDDYAKFELTDPPVVFALVPQPALTGGALSKIGLRLADEDAVAAARQRVEAAGLPTQVPAGQGTCAQHGGKFYVADPDLNYWQLYAGADVSCAPPVVAARVEPPPPGPVVWEHFVTQGNPERIPHADASVDEVRLTGTFNGSLDASQGATLLQEARRVLRPGGKVVVHGLAGDRPFSGTQPKLPGLAALVARVPALTEPVDALQRAGFVGAQFVKLSAQPWFTVDGVELRELKITAVQPGSSAANEPRHVLYRGPFAEATDDAGKRYPRGQRVRVDQATWDSLHAGAAAEQFLFFEAKGGSCARPV